MVIVHVKESKRAPIAQTLGGVLGCPVIPLAIDHFADGETHIPHNNFETIRAQNIMIVHQFLAGNSNGQALNAQIFDLMLLIRILKSAGAADITLCVPYMPYTRQDQDIFKGSSSVLHIFSSMLMACGITKIICVDPHTVLTNDTRSIQPKTIKLDAFWVDYIKRSIVPKHTDLCIATPDKGGIPRARAIADALHCPLAIIEKKRIQKNHAVALSLSGDVQNKTVVLVDDILATGWTAINACKLLKEHGAQNVIGCFSHGVITPGTHERLAESLFAKIYITDTLLHTPMAGIQTVHIGDFMAQNIRDNS